MKAALSYLLLSCLLGLQAQAQEPVDKPITVAWRDKPPYHYNENGIAQGFLLLRAKQIFTQAQVPAVFVETPAKRIWHGFEHGKPAFCSIGWYRLPERELMAQFTHAFHVDPPQIILVGPKALPAIQAHKTVAALLADPSLRLGVIDGVSYGPALDQLITRNANQVEHPTVSPTNLMRMVAANRVNYMFADEADWQYLRSREAGLESLTEYHFSDLPAGLERFIVCSKDVSSAVMAKLNRAIAALPKTP
ncbi:MAG: transporter substrate-binding domain-containing protein [Pseudomonas sp.]|nr:transporter substrate-binding domain-containing protein [Pseudomonas sp.]